MNRQQPNNHTKLGEDENVEQYGVRRNVTFKIFYRRNKKHIYECALSLSLSSYETK